MKNSTVAGLAAGSMAMASCQTSNNKIAKAVSPLNFKDDFDLNEVTIDMLQQGMKEGKYTSRSLTELYLKRIDAVDRNGPALNAVIELNPDALKIADAMDEERKAGKIRSMMHGIPILIKDNIDTADRMMTTAGAMALEGNKATYDAFIVKQLRNAGSVLLGKTNLSEWANFRSTRSTSGWSSRGRQTKNPVVLSRNPSGSSAGSGAAVAANLCAVAIGTETDGSIVSPASINGIVGIKPTVGLVSRSGIIPISATQDTAGPMARTVKDAAILLAAIAGTDANDPATNESNKKTQDYISMLDKNALAGKRIGIDKSTLDGNPDVTVLFNQAIELLKRQGAVIVETEFFKKTKDARSGEFIVLQYEFKDGVNKYLASSNSKVKTLAGVIAYNKQTEATSMPYFKQEILELCEAKKGLDAKEYTDALKKTLSSRGIIDEELKSKKLDAICAITEGPACLTDLVNGGYDNGFSCSSPAAMAGYPHITVPMGSVHELPIGISFFAGAYQEAQIINLAYAYEQASKKRRSPAFISDCKS
ncbi:MAG: amidase [Ferruginibacter sp.]